MFRWLHALPLGWRQLRHQPLRLMVAISGIAFAVILILVQLGFRAALFDSAVRYQQRLVYDVALFSTDSQFIVRPASFRIQRLYQALAVEDVVDVSPVYIFQSTWKNPWDNERRSLFTLGFDPNDIVLAANGVAEQQHLLRAEDVVLFDGKSRPEHGPVRQTFEESGPFRTEINDRTITVVGVFDMGTSFGIDASALTSDSNFLRLFPSRERDQIDLGLIRIRHGADPDAVRDALRALLPKDVLVLTRKDFIERETAYWNSATPIGYVFAFGAVMGFVVGAIIVYQILFADVSEHLNEYGTLRALGYSNGFVSLVVIQQALLLAVFGYVPGVVAAMWLYERAGAATRLPLALTDERAQLVLALTVAMCAISGLLALRKVRRLDPADVF